MSLRTRLQRLERIAPPAVRADASAEGADPPCPPGLDPHDWARRMRTSRCIEGRLGGSLRRDEYAPDMDEGDRRSMDERDQVFAELARTYAPGVTSGPWPLAGGPP